MRAVLTVISVVLVFESGVLAQRAIPGDTLVHDYRPVGETRLWTFVVEDSTIGRLASTVGGGINVNGVDGYVLREKLNLDYRRTGSPLRISVESNHFVSERGFYLGDRMNLTINEQSEQLELMRSGEVLKGYMTRGGKKIDRTFSFNSRGFAAEINFLDQHELFLAMRDVRVGDVIEDTVFMPQTMLKARIAAVVEDFINLRVYDNVFDSAFVVHYTEPQEQYLYFTPDKRLIKAVIPSREMKVYLDIVRKPPGAARKPTTKEPRASSLIPPYLVYLLSGVVSALFFVRRGYRRAASYLGLLTGGALFSLAAITQIPLQMALFKTVFLPRIAAGGSPYLWGILPALSAGVIQEGIKIVAIMAAASLGRVRKSRLASVGVTCGAGFGIAEACYIAAAVGQVELLGINLLERAFTILFHTTSGALLGHAVGHGARRLLALALLTTAVNTVFRYVPLFVQYRATTVEVMYFVLAFTSLGLLLFAALLLRKEKTT